MLAVNALTNETTLPGQTRRRVWAHPELKSHSLLVLTLTRLHLAPLAGTPKPELVSATETGDLDNLLGPLAAIVELPTVRRLKLDLLTNSVVVEYGNGGRLAVVFATSETADVCFTKLWRRLGNGYQLQPYKRDAWALSRSPLVFLVGVLVMVAALSLTLSAFEDSASARAAARLAEPDAAKSALESLLGWMDWAPVRVGGIAAGVSQVWLYRRLTRPPTSLEVMRT